MSFLSPHAIQRETAVKNHTSVHTVPYADSVVYVEMLSG